MLLIVEEGVREGICTAIYRYVNRKNKCMRHFDKNKESSWHKYWDINNLHGWAMSQTLSVKYFIWVEETF